jgi:hypothetical protein
VALAPAEEKLPVAVKKDKGLEKVLILVLDLKEGKFLFFSAFPSVVSKAKKN